jgi:serine O-acetyltransferase
MGQPVGKIATHDPVWSKLREEAEAMARNEPALASFIHTTVLSHARLESALASRLAQKLASPELGVMPIRELCQEAFLTEPSLGEAIRADILAVYDRDPACRRHIEPLLYFKGFHALEGYRVAHWLWIGGRTDMALFLQSRISEQFGVDIHPAARIGRGIMMDHATGIVIGETAVVEDEVSMLHGVTLGGTGKERGDRHPKIGRGVLIGAGAKILGNITVGHCSLVASGSVVLKPVPPNTTVAGVPAREIGYSECREPAREMKQWFELDDH